MSYITPFKHALHGLGHVYANERSFRLQCLATVVVLSAGLVVHLETWEFVLVILLCCSVLTLEVLNSAVEVVLDILKPRLSAQVGVAKDIMAGAVFLASVCSAIVGVLLFTPHILELIALI